MMEVNDPNESQLPDLGHLLRATKIDGDHIRLFRNGTEALIGVLAIVSGDSFDGPMQ